MKYFTCLFCFVIFVSCNHIKTVTEKPEELNTSLTPHRGGLDLIEVGNALLNCMQDKISFEQLSTYIPSKTEIKSLSEITNSPMSDVEITSSADVAIKTIAAGFIKSKNDGLLKEIKWADAKLDNVTSQEMPGLPVKSKLVYWNMSEGKKQFRLTAKCMQIGNYWFIGQDLQFNIIGI